MLKIQILIDNPSSWILPYAKELVVDLERKGHNVIMIHEPELVEQGDILCLLACERIFSDLHLNKHNLVVHESALPNGKGWSPVTWQILEGKNQIPVSLFEAETSVDAGVIYGQTYIELSGKELLTEIKKKQGVATNKLLMDFIEKYPNVKGVEQQGKSTFYPRRTAKDSELDVNDSLANQFNLLRVCDNDRYPAYFYVEG